MSITYTDGDGRTLQTGICEDPAHMFLRVTEGGVVAEVCISKGDPAAPLILERPDGQVDGSALAGLAVPQTQRPGRPDRAAAPARRAQSPRGVDGPPLPKPLREAQAPAGGTHPSRGSTAAATSVLPAGSMKIAAAMSEGELEAKVRDLCEGFGILRFHNPDSRRTREKGLPDDILIGPRGVLWRELKDMRRKLTPEQVKVGERLTGLGQDWGVWRPSDLLSRRIEMELLAISGLRSAGWMRGTG